MMHTSHETQAKLTRQRFHYLAFSSFANSTAPSPSAAGNPKHHPLRAAFTRTGEQYIPSTSILNRASRRSNYFQTPIIRCISKSLRSRSTTNRTMRNTIPSLLLACVFFAFPGPAHSIDPATIAFVASSASKVVSLFDSGADPSKVQLAQSHEMLTFMHERMNTFSDALDRIMLQINELPKAVRKELEYAKNNHDRALFIDFTKTLYADFDYLSAGRIPSIPLLSRLTRLDEIARLLRTGDEDLNLPYILLGMQLEKALRYGINKEDEWHGIGKDKGIKQRYAERLESMLNPHRRGSLVSSLSNLEAAIAEGKKDLLKELQTAKIEYTTSSESVSGPCGYISHYYNLNTDQIMQYAKEPLSKLGITHELPIILQIQDIYKLMLDRAKYAHNLLTEQSQVNGDTPMRPTDFLSAPGSLPQIKEAVLQSLAAHTSRIEEAKKPWKSHNEQVSFLIKTYADQGSSAMGCN